MCELNYNHRADFKLEFFTSHRITKDEWDDLVAQTCLNMEMLANESGRIRCHIHDFPKRPTKER